MNKMFCIGLCVKLLKSSVYFTSAASLDLTRGPLSPVWLVAWLNWTGTGVHRLMAEMLLCGNEHPECYGSPPLQLGRGGGGGSRHISCPPTKQYPERQR